MKKGKKALMFGLGGLLFAGAASAWLIAPDRPSKEQCAMLQDRFFAHRGLYDSAGASRRTRLPPSAGQRSTDTVRSWMFE